MKALAEQIAELDEVEIYGRVVGVRGLMVEVAGPIHAMSVGARVIDRDRRGARYPVRGRRLLRRECAADAVRAARRRAARLPGARQLDAGGGAPDRAAWLGRVVNAMGEPIDGKGPLPTGPVALSVPQSAAARACAPARRRAARSRRARAQHLHDLLPRPAHGHLRRLRRRQIGAALDAGAQRRGRRVGHRAGRRARPRGAGVPAGRSRRGRPRALGGGGRPPPTSPR